MPCYAQQHRNRKREAVPYLTLCGSQNSIRSFFHSFSSLNSVNVCSLLFTALCLLPFSPSLKLAVVNLQNLHKAGE